MSDVRARLEAKLWSALSLRAPGCRLSHVLFRYGLMLWIWPRPGESWRGPAKNKT